MQALKRSASPHAPTRERRSGFLYRVPLVPIFDFRLPPPSLVPTASTSKPIPIPISKPTRTRQDLRLTPKAQREQF